MQHTLVVPTFNRPEQIRQLVTYFKDRAPLQRVLVLDSSVDEVKLQNESMLSSYGDNLDYVTFPSTLPVGAKIARGVAMVQTPFASLCADDDLVFPDGLKEAVAFLESHDDYVGAHGLYINFQTSGKRVLVSREYAGPGNEAEYAGERIFRLLEKYESLFYAVYRRQDLIDIFASTAQLPTLHFQELFQSNAALVKGRVKRFPTAYAARQSCPPAEPERDKWQTYYWFADDPTEMLQHYVAYRDQLYTFYATHAHEVKQDQSEFKRGLDISHAVYFSAKCPADYFYSRLQPTWPPGSSGQPTGPPPLAENGDESNLKELRDWFWTWRHDFVERIKTRDAAKFLVNLDAKTAQQSMTPWVCEPTDGIRWLVNVPQFGDTWHELCAYLDKA
ncbi:MAG: TIGR00180 family glycosyltransferase [Verrucomicrobia bacterium]|nr:TIGR00180 family glycosyltransferase [Verrucomicrobiota bacterium]